jgi:biotin carboxyl carrier protein
VKIFSPVFGTLAMIYVESGGEATAGENIAQVEAMKVFFEVPAPATGIVRWSVELGETIGEGDELGEIR